ncbi:hypothetical protein F5Y03DRAFT_268068 [Xylaria venustula]|nr:hypothetical protein F5Y03DRAFT_268068 [Xylaria venustula]
MPSEGHYRTTRIDRIHTTPRMPRIRCSAPSVALPLVLRDLLVVVVVVARFSAVHYNKTELVRARIYRSAAIAAVVLVAAAVQGLSWPVPMLPCPLAVLVAITVHCSRANSPY